MDTIADVIRALLDPAVLPITVAMLAGAAAYVLSRFQPALCRLLALFASAATLGVAAAAAYRPPGNFTAEWVRLAKGVSLTVELGPSALGMVVVVGSAAFSLLIAVYSVRAMQGHRWEGKFHAYLLWALGGACIVGLARNLLVLLVGWEIVTLMLFLMVNLGRGEAKAGAAKAYAILGFTDACLLLAIVLLAAQPGGSGNWSLSGPAVTVGSLGPAGYVIYVLILAAALAKAGAVPLHTWVPAIAADAPTPVMALLPAAMDKLLGIYLLAMVALHMFRPDGAMQVVMMAIGAVTIISAVLMAMIQHNLKKLLSFHAVSQVGYMVLGIGTGTTIGVVGGLFHMINNAIYKSELFLMSGVVGRVKGSDEIEDGGGLARCLPITFTCGAVAAMAISGVPPLNGFASKWLIYQGALSISNHGLAVTLIVVAVFGSALTLASFVKVMYSEFLSAPPEGAESRRDRRNVKEDFFLAAPMVILAVGCIVLGIAPGLAIDGLSQPAVVGGAAGPLPGLAGGAVSLPQGLWSPGRATVLILLGIAIGLGFVWVSSFGRRIRVVRPFLGGEVPAPTDGRFRVPGTQLYETIRKLPAVGGLLDNGQAGAMDVYHWSGKHGGTLVQLLRAQHTGLVSLYVTWCLLGLTVTLVYLLLSMGT
jgi:formate hydrogenlyase subunit 3/multisubunit Na+/H+ antiporter MnhD subunit